MPSPTPRLPSSTMPSSSPWHEHPGLHRHPLNYWEGQYASTGFSNKRLKGIHVLDHYISMSEYEANRDAR